MFGLIALALMTPSCLPQPASAQTSPPARTAVFTAAVLGLTPESLAAAGYSGADAGSILARIQVTGGYEQVCQQLNDIDQARNAASVSAGNPAAGGPSSGPPVTLPVAESPGRAARTSLISASIESDPPGRRACLERCIEGLKHGLPPQIAVVCATASHRIEAAEALTAEQHAHHLGRATPERARTILARLRSASDHAATAARLTANQAQVRARFGDAAAP